MSPLLSCVKDFNINVQKSARIEKLFFWLWALGPFIYLIERTPADIWLTLLGIAFLIRSHKKSDWSWLSVTWVKCVGLFWTIALIVSAACINPIYSLGEAIAWIRFPLYAAACTFWLGANKARLDMIFVVMGIATTVMIGILSFEQLSNYIVTGNTLTRLEGPYGDLVPGSFLGKAMMPLAIILAATAMTKSIWRGFFLATICGAVVIGTLITGERVNTGLVSIGVLLAALSLTQTWGGIRRLILFGTFALTVIGGIFTFSAEIGNRFSIGKNPELSNYFESPYWFSIRPGIVASLNAPITGIGVGMHRLICPEIAHGPIWLKGKNECHPHPHQFYVQLAEETGMFGLLAGLIMIGSIITAAFNGRNNRTLYARLAWIPPALLFFPQPSADFFGQWNNLFLWFAVGLALAMSQDCHVSDG